MSKTITARPAEELTALDVAQLGLGAAFGFLSHEIGASHWMGLLYGYTVIQTVLFGYLKLAGGDDRLLPLTAVLLGFSILRIVQVKLDGDMSGSTWLIGLFLLVQLAAAIHFCLKPAQRPYSARAVLLGGLSIFIVAPPFAGGR